MVGSDVEYASLMRVGRTRFGWLVTDSPQRRPGAVQAAREEDKRAWWTVT